jgi:predicted ATPase/DNA-binding SARP family transcriptional activator
MPGASAPSLAIRLFGPFEVCVNGAPLPRLRSRKGQWLLALLALRHGREVERGWLAGVLWPESTGAQAFHSLRMTLTDLRRALGAEARRLQSPTPHSLCLDLAGADVDLLAFDTAIERGDMPSLERAIALYSGPLLEGCVEEWAFQERQVREQAYLAALETLAAQATQCGDPGAAERQLRLAVAADPLRESAQRALMQALAAGGNYAAALLAYRELRLRLHRTANVEPDPETQALFRQIRTEARGRAGTSAARWLRIPPTAAVVQHNLPVQRTPLLGREREVAAVCHLLLREEVGLVTLIGPAGIGKTRLGQQIATELLDDFPDGVFFVDLAPIRDPALVAAAIAQVLGVREAQGLPLIESLKAYLRPRQLLLLLDNFEQVLPAASTVAELLAAAPHMKGLVTSRVVLRLRGEQEFPVPPLAPDAAVELFVQRARAARPDFAVTDEYAPLLAAICQRLDGLPLAIELAAVRIKLFSPAALLSRLERRLPLLTGGARDLPARQQTLRDAIAWSYDLLEEAEKTLFQRLSVFVGGCVLGAAEVICHPKTGALPPLTIDLLDGVASLVDQSLLWRKEQPDGEPRFVMLETVREFALECLAASGEEPALRRRHAHCYLSLAEKADARLTGPEQAVWLDRLERELDNLRAGLEWFTHAGEAEKALRLGAALWRFWAVRGYLSEGRERLAGLLAWSGRVPPQAPSLRPGTRAAGGYPRSGWRFPPLPGPVQTAVRLKALYAAGVLADAQGDYTAARSLFEEHLGIQRESGDVEAIATALCSLGNIANAQGDQAAARSLFEEALALFQEAGTDFMLAGR